MSTLATIRVHHQIHPRTRSALVKDSFTVNSCELESSASKERTIWISKHRVKNISCDFLYHRQLSEKMPLLHLFLENAGHLRRCPTPTLHSPQSSPSVGQPDLLLGNMAKALPNWYGCRHEKEEWKAARDGANLIIMSQSCIFCSAYNCALD